MKLHHPVEIVKAGAVYPLRLLVLRPGGVLSDCVFAGDEDASTVHVGALDSQQSIRGIGSYYEAAHPLFAEAKQVQLRGMATHPDVRGQGYGVSVVQFGLERYKSTGTDLMWCNAREIAVTFYERLGFQKIGEPFLIGNIGKHWVMVREF